MRLTKTKRGWGENPFPFFIMGKVNKEEVKRKETPNPALLGDFILTSLAEVLDITHDELLLLMEYDKEWLIELLKHRGII